jgi:hypothetical protein
MVREGANSSEKIQLAASQTVPMDDSNGFWERYRGIVCPYREWVYVGFVLANLFVLLGLFAWTRRSTLDQATMVILKLDLAVTAVLWVVFGGLLLVCREWRA